MASPSATTWHSVNPQTRPLTLSILELTPLALTLSLTLAPLSPTSGHSHTPLQHVAHTHNHAHGPKHRKKARHHNRRPESEDEAEEDDAHHHLTPTGSTQHIPSGLIDLSTNFKDLLSHGVVVSVNGQPWNRIVAHVSDPEEEHEVVVDGDGEEEEGEWEDDADVAHAGEGTEGELGGEGVTRRRPRKARFGTSAGTAVKNGEDKGVIKRKQRDPKDVGKIDRDRAVVVVYGLSPGKEYEIELQVVGLTTPDGLDPLVSNSVLIPPSPSPMGGGLSRSRANSLRSRSRPRSRSNSLSTPHPAIPGSTAHSSDSSMAASPGRVTPPTSSGDVHPAPIPTNILNPVDTQAAQIRHMIAAAHAEKEHVQTQIKEARRASQRAEAALRLEIETVKKATEKAGSLDLRAKQKTLALQEQVKQGWAAAEHAEKEAEEVENGMDDLEDRLRSSTINVESVKNEFKFAKEHEEDVREKDKKTRAEEEKRLAEVTGKIEKLRAKRDKKEVEKAELEKRLEELEKQREETEKKNEEGTKSRKSSAYWWDPYQQHGQHGQHGPHNQHSRFNHGHDHGHNTHGHNDHGASRTLTNHPSLNNLAGHGGYSGFRGRGGYTGRYPSAGSVRPSPSQPSPTHAAGFHSIQHPVPTSSTSPAFRPPKPVTSSPATTNRTPSSSGVNVSALPFHPSNAFHDNSSPHTTLMPPQLQHRIYLPNVRPRPPPNFNPPPSVLAEQASRQSPTMLSTPAFPPLPGRSNSTSTGEGKNAATAGPSLASIVTRAVLSPTSALAAQGGMGTSKPSPPASGTVSAPVRSPSFPRAQSPISPVTSASTPPTTAASAGGSTTSSRQVTWGPPPSERSEFPPLSPTGPWSGFGGGLGASMVRTQTPPVLGSSQGRDSPVSFASRGGSRKGTGESG